MRSKRIKQWILTLLAAALFWGIGQFVEYKQSLPEKQPLTVYAPDDMEEAFEKALQVSTLSESHYIVMSDNPNSNIRVECAKQGDSSYEKFAYSPFVVAYNTNSDCYKKLKKAGVCSESAYDSNNYEIDFLKVIEEVIGEGKWENLGINEQGDLKVFYPSEESVYWSDFYNFLLVTLNDGRYPEDEESRAKADETITQFLNSKYAEGVIDFEDQIRRTNGFPTTVFYILPEQNARSARDEVQKSVRFLYPIKTIYVNYYIKGDELGTQVIEAFEKENFWGNTFYTYLQSSYFRNAFYTELNGSDSVYGDDNIFNIANIPTSE